MSVVNFRLHHFLPSQIETESANCMGHQSMWLRIQMTSLTHKRWKL